MFNSLRVRLTAWYVAILAVILASVGLLVYVLVARSLDTEINDSLAQVNDQAVAAVRQAATAPVGSEPSATTAPSPSDSSHNEATEPNEGSEHQHDTDYTGVLSQQALSGGAGVFILALGPDGAPLANPNNVPTSGLVDSATLAAARHDGSVRQDVNVAGSHLRLLTVALGGHDSNSGYIVTGRSLSQRDRDLRQLLILLVIGGGVGLVMAGLGGLWVGELAIRPVRRAFNRQRDFVADASHELRTPVAVIRANAESLQGKVAPGDAEALGDIVEESDQMGKLISDLMTLAQADGVGLTASSDPVDLHEVVASAARAGEHLAAERGLAFDARPAHVVVAGDEGQLRRLALILVDNAVKYTEAGGKVAISASRTNGFGVITVTDTGVGIAPEHRERLFERFYRVDKARSRAQGGFGLGLSIAQAIAQAHHGRIEIESEPGKGTTVRASLPLASLPAPAPQPEPASS